MRLRTGIIALGFACLAPSFALAAEPPQKLDQPPPTAEQKREALMPTKTDSVYESWASNNGDVNVKPLGPNPDKEADNVYMALSASDTADKAKTTPQPPKPRHP